MKHILGQNELLILPSHHRYRQQVSAAAATEQHFDLV